MRYLMFLTLLLVGVNLNAQTKIECLDCTEIKSKECYECSDKRNGFEVVSGVKINGKILTYPLRSLKGDKYGLYLTGLNGQQAYISTKKDAWFYTKSGRNKIDGNLILEALKVCMGGGEGELVSDSFVDNGDGTVTHTAVDGTVVTWGVSLIDNGDGTFSLVDINGNVLGTCEKGWTTTNYNATTNTFTFEYPDGSTADFPLPTDVLVNNDNGTWTHTSVDGDVEIITTADVVDLGNGSATITDSQGDEITVCLAPCGLGDLVISGNNSTLGSTVYQVVHTNSDGTGNGGIIVDQFTYGEVATEAGVDIYNQPYDAGANILVTPNGIVCLPEKGAGGGSVEIENTVVGAGSPDNQSITNDQYTITTAAGTETFCQGSDLIRVQKRCPDNNYLNDQMVRGVRRVGKNTIIDSAPEHYVFRVSAGSVSSTVNADLSVGGTNDELYCSPEIMVVNPSECRMLFSTVEYDNAVNIIYEAGLDINVTSKFVRNGTDVPRDSRRLRWNDSSGLDSQQQGDCIGDNRPPNGTVIMSACTGYIVNTPSAGSSIIGAASGIKYFGVTNNN